LSLFINYRLSEDAISLSAHAC